MPSAATQAPGNTSPNRGGSAPRPSVPFIRASARHLESAFYDTTNAISASQVDLGVIEIPAYGYVKSIILYVQATGGNLTVAAGAEDAPFNALQNIQFNEPNGAQIAQFNDGYECMLSNKWGGYQGPGLSNDPRANPLYTGVSTTTGQFQFCIRIPVELDLRSALGSLPNQAANATFRLRLSIAPTSTIYTTTTGTTPPSLRVRAFVETWDQPEVASGGVVNQTVPPAMNTTQFWSRQVYNLGAGGTQTVRLTRVGNYIRQLIFILRSGVTTPRANAQALWSSVGGAIGNVTFFLDSRPTEVINDDLWRMRNWEKSGGLGGGIAVQTAAGSPNAFDQSYGQENGVRVLEYNTEFDGNYGRENRDLWQPTLGSTRFEIQSNFGVLTNGTLTVLTNDVAIAGNVFLG